MGGHDVGDRPECCVHQVDHVRPDVHQHAAGGAPSGPAVRVAQQRPGQPPCGTARPATRVTDAGKPLAGVLRVAHRQHHQRRHTRVVDRGGDPLGRLEVTGKRLLEDDVLTRPCSPFREPALHRRRDREGDGVDRVQQFVERVGRPRAVLVGELARHLGTPRPDGFEFRRRMVRQPRCVHGTGPRPTADEADPQLRVAHAPQRRTLGADAGGR